MDSKGEKETLAFGGRLALQLSPWELETAADCGYLE